MRERGRGRRGNATLPALLVLLAASTARAGTEACAPWPGEPTPLATTSSPDALLSRWASLRAEELSASARASETGSPALARRLWQHVLCLDPKNAGAASGLERARAVTVFRPEVVAAARSARTAADDGNALDDLDAPIRVAMAPAPAPERLPAKSPAPATPAAVPPPDWTRTDAALGQAEARIRGADFESALADAERVRRDLQPKASAPGAGERRARAEVLAATAEVALGRDDAARRSFERALAANPKLILDPATTSPKVRRVFEAARAAQGAKP